MSIFLSLGSSLISLLERCVSLLYSSISLLSIVVENLEFLAPKAIAFVLVRSTPEEFIMQFVPIVVVLKEFIGEPIQYVQPILEPIWEIGHATEEPIL